jgi:hypothetical protein
MDDLEAWSKSIHALDLRCIQVHRRLNLVSSLKYQTNTGHVQPRIGKQAALVRLAALVERLTGERRALRLAGRALHDAYMRSA